MICAALASVRQSSGERCSPMAASGHASRMAGTRTKSLRPSGEIEMTPPATRWLALEVLMTDETVCEDEELYGRLSALQEKWQQETLARHGVTSPS